VSSFIKQTVASPSAFILILLIQEPGTDSSTDDISHVSAMPVKKQCLVRKTRKGEEGAIFSKQKVASSSAFFQNTFNTRTRY
jgi:hypothetical protein